MKNTYYYLKGEVRQVKRLHKNGQTTKHTVAKLPTMEEALKIIAQMDEEERVGN